jgi:hypothetical protein
MLTYTTIFIASIVLALIALVFYRLALQSSKSILSSKGPVSIISTPNPQKGTAPFTTTGTPALAGQKSHVTPGHIAKTHPAMPTEKVDWGWQTDKNQVRELHPHHGTGGGKTGHCSLYNDADPVAPPNRSAGRLHREEKREAYGKAYKVTRKVDPQDSSLDDSGQPWGW